MNTSKIKLNTEKNADILKRTIQAVKDLLKGCILSFKMAITSTSCYIKVNTKDGVKKIRVADHKTRNKKDLDLNLIVNMSGCTKEAAINTLKNNLQLA